MGLPLIIAGGANVRHPHFNLSRPRSCDVMVFSFVDLLVMSCNLRCATPVHRSPTSAEPVKIASSSPEVVPLESRCTRESDVACRPPACCPMFGSGYCQCVAQAIFLPVPSRPEVRCWPLLRDWKPTLFHAQQGLCCATQRNPPDYASHARCFTEQSEGGRLLDPSGRMILQHCHVRILVQALREFGQTFVRCTPDVTKLIASAGQLPPSEMRWHTGASIS